MPKLALALVCAALLAGCPSGTATQPAHPATTTTSGKRAPSHSSRTGAAGHHATGATTDASSPAIRLPDTGIACADNTCVYHAGGDAYYLCLSGGNGTCFHYGRTCEPSHRCMYDAGSGGYRRCPRVTEGRCEQFGAACEPPDRCMYNARDGLHHVCDDVRDGKCQRHGALCDPR